MSNKEFTLTDVVLRRIVQIVQEGFLTGTDVTDHMRMIRLVESADDPMQMTLTDEYIAMVEINLRKQVERAEELQANISKEPNITRGDN